MEVQKEDELINLPIKYILALQSMELKSLPASQKSIVIFIQQLISKIIKAIQLMFLGMHEYVFDPPQNSF